MPVFENEQSWGYKRREQAKKVLPVGQYYRDNYRPVRVDSKTIKLVKDEKFRESE